MQSLKPALESGKAFVIVLEHCPFTKKANVGTRLTIDILAGPWIILTLLSYWTTFVSTKIPLKDLNVAQFITSERKWDVEILSSLFGPDLLDLITSIPLSLSLTQLVEEEWAYLSYKFLRYIRSLWQS